MTSKDPANDPVWVWGIPLAPWTLAATVEAVSSLIERGQPRFFITANTHYAMLTRKNHSLQEVNANSAFIVADGAPLVWAARRLPVRLPERVAGSDLIFAISELAARKGYRVFFAGGSPGVAEAAARKLSARYPGLRVVGALAPLFGDRSASDYVKLKAQLQGAQPQLLIIAATMPQGEQWLAANMADLGVPVGVNLGAALDFAAGRMRRAPRWMQVSGLEWAFRLMLEPGRLFPRYARNAWFVLRMTLGGPCHVPTQLQRQPTVPPTDLSGSQSLPR
jgi:N-acetylglucosaminyldiphosphoundecaprenol N-acetyl-beta-D-mannosaminyltransferase